MTYSELKKQSDEYAGALLVESLISGFSLHRLERWVRTITLVLGALFLLFFLLQNVPLLAGLIPASSAVANGYFFFSSLFSFFLGIYILITLLYAFFASTYFKDTELTLAEFCVGAPPRLSFQAAHVAAQGRDALLLDFLSSRFGVATLFRLGISPDALGEFLKGWRPEKEAVSPAISVSEGLIGLPHLARALYASEPSVQHFLNTQAVNEDDFVGAAEWVSRIEERYKKALRFWGKDRLGRIPGIGKDWAYGETALLERFTVEMTLHPVFTMPMGAFGKHEAEEVERILSRERESNALLIGEAGVPLLAIMARLTRNIISGSILPPLEHKRVFVLDGPLFASAMKEKVLFESEFIKLLSEAARAGNIILVFDHFDTFFERTHALEVDLLALLDPFLTSPNIQLVALAETSAFHEMLEQHPKIKERFERVLVKGAGMIGSIPILEDEAMYLETREGVYFTFQALRSVAESADRYFTEGIMPDKAIDLLMELPPKVKMSKKRLITREDVLDLVSKKTGVVLGEAKGEERTKLLKLEEILHERIVGQDEAVEAISGALRRARAGVSNTNRPVGSFLFLGPTGVGKTETTKALAQVFFGDENAIMRFDMSEYQSGDALDRLIGTFGGKPGVLASLLRERPYGVLLLDEFEKTDRTVHDLFLQILDEGFFADATGKRVNARNLMIIATSNAGSDMIWKMVGEGKPLSRDMIITEIISRGIFRPEFLNRFDGIILFHPLSAIHLRTIARFQLEKLSKRLKEKGLELIITEPLIDFLVTVGQDPKFGARPMNRAIQERVEQIIAEKLLRGEIGPGSRVELGGEELSLSQGRSA